MKTLVISIGGTTTVISYDDSAQIRVPTYELASIEHLLSFIAEEYPNFFRVDHIVVIWPGRGDFRKGIVIGRVLKSEDHPIGLKNSFEQIFQKHEISSRKKSISIISDMQALAWGVRSNYTANKTKNSLIVNFGTGVGLSIIKNGQILLESGPANQFYGQVGRFLLVNIETRKMIMKFTEDGSIPDYNHTKYMRLSSYIYQNRMECFLGEFIAKAVDAMLDGYGIDHHYKIFLSGGIVSSLKNRNASCEIALENRTLCIDNYKEIEIDGARAALKNNSTILFVDNRSNAVHT